MARTLGFWQRNMIVHTISSKKRLTTPQIAKLIKCSERCITNIRKDMRLFGPNSPPRSRNLIGSNHDGFAK
jgi:hypothetical protein